MSGRNSVFTTDRVTIYANPFHHSATISFDNPESEPFTLSISGITIKIIIPDQITTGNKFSQEKVN